MTTSQTKLKPSTMSSTITNGAPRLHYLKKTQHCRSRYRRQLFSYIALFAAFSVVAIPLTGCTEDKPDIIINDDPTTEPASVKKLGTDIKYERSGNIFPEDPDTQQFAKTNNTIGIEVTNAMSKKGGTDANVALSPYALSMALTMLSEGASGDLAKIVDEKYSMPAGKRAEAANQLISIMKDYEPENLASVDLSNLPKDPVFHSANHLVLLEQIEPRPAYIASIRKNMDAEITSTNSTDASRILDSWASLHSANMIKKSGMEMTRDSRFVIQNGTFFASQWSEPFDEKDTRPRDFTTASKQVVKTDFMYSKQPAPYILNGDWVAVRIPYSGIDFEATIMMNNHKNAVEITPTEIEELLPNFESSTDVEIYLPVIHISQTYDILDGLESAGIPMRSPLSLEGIDKELIVAEGQQQVVIDITEEGTRAAAVQEFHGQGAGAPPPIETPILRFNRPYIFQIRHVPTGAILFNLLINNPNDSQ